MVRDWRNDNSIRRLGERRPMVMPVPAFVLRPKTGLMRRGIDRMPVHLDNVSVTGVGFYAAMDKPMMMTESVTLEVAGTSTQIRIRRVEPGDGGWTYYGAQFIDPQQRVLMAIEDMFTGGEQSAKDVRWESGSIR